jgi:hypothetical protein
VSRIAHTTGGFEGDPAVSPHAFRRERALPALAPSTVVIDDRGPSDVIAKLVEFANGLRYYTAHDVGRLHHRPDATWAPFIDDDVSFLLAQMAVADPVREFHESLRVGDEQGFAQLDDEAKARIGAWRAWARRLHRKVHAAPASLDVPRRRPDDSVESALHATIEDVWKREIESGERGAGHRESAAERFQATNRAMRRLREIAVDYLERSLSEKSNHEPHAGLLLAFVRLLMDSKAHLNGLTARHLDFYYREVLRLTPAHAGGDRTILVLGLAPSVRRFDVAVGTRFSAGVDDAGAPIVYTTEVPTTLTHARVDALRAVYTTLATPLAGMRANTPPIAEIIAVPAVNSADGRGTPITDATRGWPIFGTFDQSEADLGSMHAVVGLVVTSPMLLLREGERRITVTLSMSDQGASTLPEAMREFAKYAAREFEGTLDHERFLEILHDAFLVEATTTTGYVPVAHVDIKAALPHISARPEDTSPESNQICFEIRLPPTAPPLVAPEAAADDLPPHVWPSLRIRVNRDARIFPYSWLECVNIERVGIRVQVSGLQRLNLQGAHGPMETGKPFPVFGALPARGARLLFANDELWDKPLEALRFTLEWSGLPEAPADFKSYYAPYELGTKTDSFRGQFSILQNFQWVPLSARVGDHAARATHVALFAPAAGGAAGVSTDASWSLDVNRRLHGAGVRRGPLLIHTAEAADGFFSLELTDPPYAFAHAAYPGMVVQAATGSRRARARARELMVRPPITPVGLRASVDYTAFAELSVPHGPDDAVDPLGAVYHADPFGPIRRLTQREGMVLRVRRRGYLFIGLLGVNALESLSLLVRMRDTMSVEWSSGCRDTSPTDDTVAEGPSDIQWRYKAADGWCALPPESILDDGTDGLRQTGIIRLVPPADFVATPWGIGIARFWLELSVDGDPRSYGRVLDIRPHAVAVRRESLPTDVSRAPSLAAGGITRLLDPIVEIVGVDQPDDSTGGREPETTATFYARVSERLRHKNRAILPRDYESIVLDAFPTIGEARCVAIGGGSVMVVVVPLRERPDAAALPYIPAWLCQNIATHLRRHVAPGVRHIHVRSPWYEPVRVTARLRFVPGRELDGLAAVVADINDFIAPWRLDPRRRLPIGGASFEIAELQVHLEHRRALLGLDRIEGLSAMHYYRDSTLEIDVSHTLADWARDGQRVSVRTAWSVLVPAMDHRLFLDSVASTPTPTPPERAGIGNLRIGRNFVVANESTRGRA